MLQAKSILNCSFVPFMFNIIQLRCNPEGRSVTEDSLSEGATDHLCLREKYDYFFPHLSSRQSSKFIVMNVFPPTHPGGLLS